MVPWLIRALREVNVGVGSGISVRSGTPAVSYAVRMWRAGEYSPTILDPEEFARPSYRFRRVDTLVDTFTETLYDSR